MALSDITSRVQVRGAGPGDLDGARCDVLLLSATFALSSARQRGGGGGGSADSLVPRLVAALQSLPSLQACVFLSGTRGAGAQAWARAKPAHSFHARLGSALMRMARRPPPAGSSSLRVASFLPVS